MSVTVTLPDALGRRVEAVARAQGRDVDDVVADVLECGLPVEPEIEERAKRRFAFIGAVEGPSDWAATHKQRRREAVAERGTADL